MKLFLLLEPRRQKLVYSQGTFSASQRIQCNSIRENSP